MCCFPAEQPISQLAELYTSVNQCNEIRLVLQMLIPVL